MDFRKINTILMRVFAVLLMLVLLSTAMVTGRFARYISSASGSDSARVAKFDVDYTLTPVANENGKYTLQVTNNSEVAVKYSVDIVFTNVELTNGNLDVKLNDQDGTFANNTFSFGEMEQLAPNTTGTKYPLTIAVANWKLLTKEAQNVATYEKELAFTVKVTAVQID